MSTSDSTTPLLQKNQSDSTAIDIRTEEKAFPDTYVHLSFRTIDDNTCYLILQYLKVDDLLIISLVSKRWNAWANNDNLWRDTFNPRQIEGLFRSKTQRDLDSNSQYRSIVHDLEGHIKEYKPDFVTNRINWGQNTLVVCPNCRTENDIKGPIFVTVECSNCSSDITDSYFELRETLDKWKHPTKQLPLRVQFVVAMREVDKLALRLRNDRGFERARAKHRKVQTEFKSDQEIIGPAPVLLCTFVCFVIATLVTTILLNLELADLLDCSFLTLSIAYMVPLGFCFLFFCCRLSTFFCLTSSWFFPWEWTGNLLNYICTCVGATYLVIAVIYSGVNYDHLSIDSSSTPYVSLTL